MPAAVRNLPPVVLIIVIGVLVGISFALSKIAAMAGVPPFVALFQQLLVASLLLLVVSVGVHKQVPQGPSGNELTNQQIVQTQRMAGVTGRTAASGGHGQWPVTGPVVSLDTRGGKRTFAARRGLLQTLKHSQRLSLPRIKLLLTDPQHH
jgi:negative regulator of sigma E activity